MADAKAVKACVKEGGKKGVDLAGMADLGGVKYFNVSVEEPKGDFELLKHVMAGANAEVEEGAEERKGGAGHIGKMFLSAGDKQLAIYCHVPKALSEEKGVGAQEWIEAVLKPIKGKIVETSEDGEFIMASSEGDAERGCFPLKMRDEAIGAGFAFLREKSLVIDDESDDDVNYAEAAGVEW